MMEYSPLPGTVRSNTREVTEEPCTKNTIGLAGSPDVGAPRRLRYIHKGTSPFLAQYSPLQISLPSTAAALVGEAPVNVPATRPRPAPLMTARRAKRLSSCVMWTSLPLSLRCSRFPDWSLTTADILVFDR